MQPAYPRFLYTYSRSLSLSLSLSSAPCACLPPSSMALRKSAVHQTRGWHTPWTCITILCDIVSPAKDDFSAVGLSGPILSPETHIHMARQPSHAVALGKESADMGPLTHSLDCCIPYPTQGGDTQTAYLIVTAVEFLSQPPELRLR